MALARRSNVCPAAYGNDPANWQGRRQPRRHARLHPRAPTTPLIAVETGQITVSVQAGEAAAPVFLRSGTTACRTCSSKSSTRTLTSASRRPAASTGPTDLSVHTVNFAAPPIGTYAGTLLVQDGGSGATNGPVALAVTLTVVPVPTPEIGLSSLSLAASTVAGMDALDLGLMFGTTALARSITPSPPTRTG